jgi:hypothetical protein
MSTDNKKSWAQQGFDGTKKEEERLATMYGPNRVWLKPGTSQEFVFVDDTPFCFYEHNPKIDGSWKNWITCLKDVSDGEVPCCEILGQNSRYYVGYLTVVDMSKWTDKKGNVHQYEVKLLPAKLKTLKKFKRKKEERKSLVGCIYRATREDDKSANVGDEFEFVKEADISKVFDVANYKGTKLAEMYAKAMESPEQMAILQKIFTVPLVDGKILPKVPAFNYYSIFEPKSPRDCRTALAGATMDRDDAGGAGGAAAAGGSAGADEDIPF